jgi:hypothetical protein
MYSEFLYKQAHVMAAEKTVSVSFRVSPEFKAMLEAAALRERRSQTNMLETLLLEHCCKHGIQPETPNNNQQQGSLR